METTTDLAEQLRTVNVKEFHRPALPAVYAEYVAFMETRAYPYIDRVAAWIGERAGIPVLPYHNAPGWGLDGDLTPKLHHEVYLASGQFRLAEMATTEVRLAAEGFRPITELVPAEGMKIRVADGRILRLKAVDETYHYVTDAEGVRRPTEGHDWLLLAPGYRINGQTLDELVNHHCAYERAKAAGQTSMDAPSVVMYRTAK